LSVFIFDPLLLPALVFSLTIISFCVCRQALPGAPFKLKPDCFSSKLKKAMQEPAFFIHYSNPHWTANRLAVDITLHIRRGGSFPAAHPNTLSLLAEHALNFNEYRGPAPDLARGMIDTRWLRKQSAVPGEQPRDAEEQAEHSRVVAKVGFPGSTPLVEEQCMAVQMIGGLPRWPAIDVMLLPDEHLWVLNRGSGLVETMLWETLEAGVRAEPAGGVVRFLLQMPVGSGKTPTALTILCHVLGRRGMTADRPVVAVVPTMVLAQQMKLAMSRFTKLKSIILCDKNMQKGPHQDAKSVRTKKNSLTLPCK
jgi:hypothetical protein